MKRGFFNLIVSILAGVAPVASFAQQCNTSAFTYNQSSGEYYMPGGAGPATSAAQCSCLQQQWNAITQQIQTAHTNCLNAHQGEPTNPNSGSYPDSSCSISSCQSLHDALYTTMAPQQQQEMNACNASVAQYQAQQQAQQTAQQQQQAAQQAAQQQRAQELAAIKQRIAAILQANQNALQTNQNASQQFSALLQQLLTHPSQQPGNSQTAQGANTGSTAGTSVSSSGPSAISALNDVTSANSQQSTLSPDLTATSSAPSNSSTNSWDPANPPPLSADVLNSSNPDIQSLVAKLQSLQNAAVNNVSMQANLTDWAAQGQSDSLWAAGLGSFAAVAKLPADTFAAVLSTDPETEWYSVLYGTATNTAKQISTGLVSGGEQGGQSPEVSAETLKNTADFLSVYGKTLQEGSPSLGAYTGSVGTAVSVGGGVLGAAVNASESNEAAAQGDSFKAATSGAAAIASGAGALGTLAQNSQLTESAGALGAAATIVSSAQESSKMLIDSAQDLSYATTTIPQNYAAAYAKTQALNAQLATQEQAIYLQIQQLLQSQNAGQTITVNVPQP